MNINPKISIAGIWKFINTPGYDINTFHSQVFSLPNGSSGLVFSGNIIVTNPTITVQPAANVAIFSQAADGTLNLSTSTFISDPSINGSTMPIVADFNGDGISDIVLVGYAEHPYFPWPDYSPVAYFSNSHGSYDRTVINIPTLSHDPVLTNLNGVPTIVTGGYSSSEPLIQYNATSKTFTTSYWSSSTGQQGSATSPLFDGTSEVIGHFLGDTSTQLVLTDNSFGPGYTNNGLSNAPKIVVYNFNGTQIQAGPVAIIDPYFNDKPQYANIFGADLTHPGWTHTYRVWADDFNHDGLTDIVAGERIGPWDGLTAHFAALQMLQNGGSFHFVDKTDSLGSAISLLTDQFDYSMQMFDLDHSGINSYLMGSNVHVAAENSNYFLVNDGTGKLYAALHDQFIQWSVQANAYATAQGLKYNLYFSVQNFVAYQTSDGAIDYAVQFVADMASGTIPILNFPIHYNITTDFTQNITIADRNQSMLMRTWAGNDTFYDTNANTSAAHLDGGLGSNASVYSDKAANYTVSALGSGSFEIQHIVTNSAPNVDDTLINISRLQFTDTMVALDIGPTQTAGAVYMLYQATFNRTPDAAGLGYWIAQVDKGANIVTNVAASFVASPEFVAKYGSNPSNASYVDNLYQNVLHRAGDAGGITYWNTQLNSGAVTKAYVLEQFATLPEGAANVAPTIAHGIAYQQWVG